MTAGIGNPDWQRRYTTSAAPLLGLNYPDNQNSVSAISDSNGFQYLICTVNMGSSTVYAHVKVDWYQDSAGSIFMGTTDWTVPPQSFIAQKVPVMTRYYKVEIGNVGGATGHTINLAVYGTNADQENLLTQNTAILQCEFHGSVAAGATQQTVTGGIFGGDCMMVASVGSTNKWDCWGEYYNWTTQTWNQFWIASGADKGTRWSERIICPYAPTRFNIRNNDTVAHNMDMMLVCP